MSNELDLRTKLLKTYNKLKDDPLTKEDIQKIHPQMQDFFSDEESLLYDLSKYMHISQGCSSLMACISDHLGIVF